jgi:hypothetical protein
MKETKYEYLHVVQGYYGHGWEDLCASEARDVAFEDFHAYEFNEPDYPHRVIKRRSLREEIE